MRPDLNRDVLGTRFEFTRQPEGDPFQLIHCFMTSDYAGKHEAGFEHRAMQWQHTCREIDPWKERPVWCESNCNASREDFRNLFDVVTTQSFLVGEMHTDKNNFIENNIEDLARRGFDTLFLEGVPYEAQGLIDAYIASGGPRAACRTGDRAGRVLLRGCEGQIGRHQDGRSR